MSPSPSLPLIPVSSDTPPDEIIFNILLKLPPASLVRCSCVCKTWKSIIRSQTFNMNYRLSKPQRCVFLYTDRLKHCARVGMDASGNLINHEIYSFTNRLYPTPVGSCYGLLCFTNPIDFGRGLCLWNPTIRKHKILDSSCLFLIHLARTYGSTINFNVGLGFDSKTNDYKILRIAYHGFPWTRRGTTTEISAEIYSLSSDSWREVIIPKNIARRFVETKSEKYAHSNGNLYWLVKLIDKEGEIYFSILSFDVSEERFEEIELPIEYAKEMDWYRREVIVFRGLVGLMMYRTRMDMKGENCCVWTKNGSVWSKERGVFEGKFEKFECVGDYLVWQVGLWARFLHYEGGPPFEATFRGLSQPYSRFFTFRESLALL